MGLKILSVPETSPIPSTHQTRHNFHRENTTSH